MNKINKRHFYALFDTTVSKNNAGYGFANRKECVAFDSKEERDDFLEERSSFDFGSKPCTRKAASEYTEKLESVNNPTGYDVEFIIRKNSNWADYVVLRGYNF